MRRLACLVLFAACVPDLGERDSLVDETVILAVRGEPPEVAPGSSTHFDVLVATPKGPMIASSTRLDFCASAKRLTENGSVSAACLGESGVIPAAIDAKIPENACNVFGPRTLGQDERPRDPDITGGYYQPLRVIVDGEVGFGFERIACGPPLAPANVIDQFSTRYHANRNPSLEPIAPPTVARGARVVLRASWPADAPETFAVYDLATKTLVDHRESMRVSWFATAGTFDADRTGRDETETELFTENGWTAPAAPQTVWFYVVLRDPRGGTAFQSFSTTLE
jgi:hypothetical protein